MKCKEAALDERIEEEGEYDLKLLAVFAAVLKVCSYMGFQRNYRDSFAFLSCTSTTEIQNCTAVISGLNENVCFVRMIRDWIFKKLQAQQRFDALKEKFKTKAYVDIHKSC